MFLQFFLSEKSTYSDVIVSMNYVLKDPLFDNCTWKKWDTARVSVILLHYT